ncbi:hypothetical protein ACHAXR_010430 [Thalassiosira sp. AJA248-18]
MIWFAVITTAISLHHAVKAFSPPRIGINHPHRSSIVLFSSQNDDWTLEDSGEEEDPRLQAMRSMLEGSWDGAAMGTVPSNSEKAAEAASESIADAMGQNKNVLMIDLRLPSYDITEGPKSYDIMAAYDFCSFLSDNLRDLKLIRKSLVLVRNEKERVDIDVVVSQRDGQTISANEDDDDIGGAEAWGTAGGSEGSEVDDFREKLMNSWESVTDDISADEGAVSSTFISPSPASQKKTSESNNSSHRLWSMVGSEDISSGPDMFNDVITAVDKHALLSTHEDALIILSPYDTTDVIGVRRIMARYGMTRTIIIVNSRMETMPRELDPAELVYGILPLIARSKGNDDENEAGLKAVVMKRFPADWTVFVDVQGDGFVEAKGTQSVIDSSAKQFPSPEWIVQRVQAHVEGMSKQ